MKIAKGVQIEKVDQDKINAFSRLNMQLQELKADKKKKQEELDAIEDSFLAVEESFGEGLLLAMGEVYISADEDLAKEFLDKALEDKKMELENVEDSIDDYMTKMKDLKIQLYAKFGSQINLD
jgi:prefoldin subunit 4